MSLASLSCLAWCLSQTLKLIMETVNYGRNKFYDTGPSLLLKVQRNIFETKKIVLLFFSFLEAINPSIHQPKSENF
jgi:hypothetical protein